MARKYRRKCSYRAGQKVLFHVEIPEHGIDEWKEATVTSAPVGAGYIYLSVNHAIQIAFADSANHKFWTTYSKIKLA